MTDFEGLLKLLADGNVDYILIGGMAGIAHGAARVTYDLDIVYDRSPANIQRLVSTLLPIHPYLRGAPPGLPFHWDVETVTAGLNFTLSTSIGDLDILGDIPGGRIYEELLPHSTILDVAGIPCRCLNLKKLIEVKRAAARKKDLDAIAELEALLQEQQHGSGHEE
ncbi:MAG: hypothetical protein AB7G28_01130 [Pirellulales bacterium]